MHSPQTWSYKVLNGVSYSHHVTKLHYIVRTISKWHMSSSLATKGWCLTCQCHFMLSKMTHIMWQSHMLSCTLPCIRKPERLEHGITPVPSSYANLAAGLQLGGDGMASLFLRTITFCLIGWTRHFRNKEKANLSLSTRWEDIETWRYTPLTLNLCTAYRYVVQLHAMATISSRKEALVPNE
jgi:hypothetical protein